MATDLPSDTQAKARRQNAWTRLQHVGVQPHFLKDGIRGAPDGTQVAVDVERLYIKVGGQFDPDPIAIEVSAFVINQLMQLTALSNVSLDLTIRFPGYMGEMVFADSLIAFHFGEEYAKAPDSLHFNVYAGEIAISMAMNQFPGGS